MIDQDPLEHSELTFLLGMAFQLVLTEFVHRLDAAGYEELRPVHGLIFQVLRDDGATITELASQLGITKQAVGQTVDYLEEHGYVERTEHPYGGRRKLIVLTDKAREHLNVAGPILHQLEAELADRQKGRADLKLLRSELVHLIRGLTGDSIPPLRPVW